MSLFSPIEADFGKLQGKVVVLTGGANGIGAATVKLCHDSGASVVFGDVNESAGQAVAASVGERARFVQVDVTKYADHVKLFKTALDAHGRVDHAFSIAGVLGRDNWFDDGLTVEDVSNEELKTSVIDVNLMGTMYFCRVALPFLREGGGMSQGKDKSLVVMSSVAGFEDSSGIPIYGTSKHGVMGLMRSLRKRDQATREVRVNAVCPSMTVTDMTKSFADTWTGSGLPGQSAESVGKVVIGLATQDVNGLAVYVQGGKGWDIESGLLKTKAEWAGQEAHELFQKVAEWASGGARGGGRPMIQGDVTK